jgi:hypothetical protein
VTESRIDVRLDANGSPVGEWIVEEHAGDDRPCGYCGRPVPQRNAAGRPFRYCRDNEGECQRNARNARMRQRTSPGLTGQVARAFEIAERLDQSLTDLVEALHAEVSTTGIERRVAEARAEAAAGVVTAHAERDDAREETRKARVAVQQAQDETARLRVEADESHAMAMQARGDLLQAQADLQAARDETEHVHGESTARLAEAQQRVDAADERSRRIAAEAEAHGRQVAADAAATVGAAQQLAERRIAEAQAAAAATVAEARAQADQAVAGLRPEGHAGAGGGGREGRRIARRGRGGPGAAP